VWLERGAEHDDPKSGVPAAVCRTRSRRITWVSSSASTRTRVAYRGGHRRRRGAARRGEGASDAPPSRSAVGVGGALQSTHVGDRVGRWARLPVGPTARRRRRAGRGRAGDAGGAGAGVGHGTLQQERSQRRVLGGSGGAASAATLAGRPTMPGCCGCWRSATTSWVGPGTRPRADSMPCWPSSCPAGSPMKSTPPAPSACSTV